MPEEPLYEDKQLKIDYARSAEDHELIIKVGREQLSYLIQRGILHDMARAQRGGLARIVELCMSPHFTRTLEKEGISMDGLHVAICQAYMEKEERARAYAREVLRTA